MLAKRFPRMDDDERLSIYHDAWARVYAKRRRGEQIDSLRAYLIATAGAEAMHAVSRGRPPAPIGPDDPRLTMLADDRAAVEEQVVARDQARLARNLLDTLDQRQRDVLKLRWDLQLSGAEVRAALGLSRRQYARLAEEGAATIAERVRELEDGTWSRRQRSLLAACLVEVTCDGEQRVGIATDRQREEAQRLLESDPHVAALYVEVRGAVKRASALLPLPVLLNDADASAATRVAELISEARTQVAGAIQTGKHQATSLYVRAADPSILSGPRPGTLLALAGCLAATGGAYTTYQATSNPSPPTTAAQTLAPTNPQPPNLPEPPKPRRQKQPRTTTPSTPAPIPQPSSQTTNATPPAPSPSTPTTSSPPTPPPTAEFGFED
jgi:DNA-directed RNA polymerase specialized sigma24 family protein